MGENLEKKLTDIYGLKYLPSIGSLDSEDYLPGMFDNIKVTQTFSKKNQDKLLEYFNKIKHKCNCIVEVGVDRDGYDASSTSIFIENKLDETFYIGIDTVNKSNLNNKQKNIYTLQTNSHNRVHAYEFLDSLGINKIDFLFIDGYHSINTVVNDWQYTEKLSDFGIVGFHDTNYHPGPLYVFDAIDEKLYKKNKYFENLNDDWGVGFAEKI